MASVRVCNAQLMLNARRYHHESTAAVGSRISWSRCQVPPDVNVVKLSADENNVRPPRKSNWFARTISSQSRRSCSQQPPVSSQNAPFFASAEAAIRSFAELWSKPGQSAQGERHQIMLDSISDLVDEIKQLQERMKWSEDSAGLGLKPAKDLQSRVASLADRAILLHANAQRCLSREGRMPTQMTATYEALKREHESLGNILRLASSGMGPLALLQPGRSSMAVPSIVPPTRSLAVSAAEVAGVSRGARGTVWSHLAMKRSRSAADVRCQAMVPGRSGGLPTAGFGSFKKKPLYTVSAAAMKALPALGGFRAEIERRVRDKLGKAAHALRALPEKAAPLPWGTSTSSTARSTGDWELEAGRRGGRGGTRGRGGIRPTSRIVAPSNPMVASQPVVEETAETAGSSSSSGESMPSAASSNGSYFSKSAAPYLPPSPSQELQSNVGRFRSELVRAKSAVEALREARVAASLPREVVPAPDFSGWSPPEVVSSLQAQVAYLTSQLGEKEALLALRAATRTPTPIPTPLSNKPVFYGRPATRTATQAGADIARKDAELAALRRQLAESQAEKRRLEQRTVQAELGESMARRQVQELGGRLDGLKQMLRRGKSAQALQRISALLRESASAATLSRPAGEPVGAGAVVRPPSVYNPQIASRPLSERPAAAVHGTSVPTTSWWTTSVPKKGGSWVTFTDGEEVKLPPEIPGEEPAVEGGAEGEEGEEPLVEVAAPAGAPEEGVGPAAAREVMSGALLEEVALDSPVEEEEEEEEEAQGAAEAAPDPPAEEPEPQLSQNGHFTGEPPHEEEVVSTIEETTQQEMRETEPCIVINYLTGWDTAYLHFSADGSGWTDLPGLPMETEERVEGMPPFKVIAVAGELLEFVVTDGRDNWDQPPGGGNYTITKSGTYVLQNGEIQELLEAPAEQQLS